MSPEFYTIMENNPVIAAVKSWDDLRESCKLEEIRVVFVLFGDICTVGSIVDEIKAAGKLAIVHVDLITGLVGKEIAVDFIHTSTHADGVISTKPGLIRRARELGLYTVLRIFLLDSMAMDNLPHQVSMGRPDLVELLPGLMPKMIRLVRSRVRVPIIAGGLIADKEDVVNALDAGAIAVSSTNQNVWSM